MPRNGTGGYTSPTPDVVPGTLIQAAVANGKWDDLGNEIANSIAADGQTTPTANLPMGGFQHTNVADATVANQYAAFGQIPFRIIGRTTAAAAAFVDYTWSANYKFLLLYMQEISVSALAQICVRCMISGVPDTGGSDYYYGWTVAAPSSATTTVSETLSSLIAISPAIPTGTAANSMQFLINPGAVGTPFTVAGRFDGVVNGPANQLYSMMGRRTANGVKDGIRILPTAGTMSGEILLLGAL